MEKVVFMGIRISESEKSILRNMILDPQTVNCPDHFLQHLRLTLIRSFQLSKRVFAGRPSVFSDADRNIIREACRFQIVSEFP